MQLSKNKKRALNQLQRAFKACDRAGLVLADIDSRMTVYERKEFKKLLKKHEDKNFPSYHAVKEADNIKLDVDNWMGGYGM